MTMNGEQRVSDGKLEELCASTIVGREIETERHILLLAALDLRDARTRIATLESDLDKAVNAHEAGMFDLAAAQAEVVELREALGILLREAAQGRTSQRIFDACRQAHDALSRPAGDRSALEAVCVKVVGETCYAVTQGMDAWGTRSLAQDEAIVARILAPQPTQEVKP